MRLQAFIASVLVIALIALVACTTVPGPGPVPDQGNGNIPDASGIKKFASMAELSAYLKENAANAAPSYGGRGAVLFESAKMGGMPTAAPSADSSMGSGGADEFSTTNLQVEGVDEADFVKNDDKYIYVLSGQKLVIIDAFPASEGRILSTTVIEGNPSDLFVSGDRLVAFTQSHLYVPVISEYDYRPQEQYSEQTLVQVYDISDREKPQLDFTFSINGNYFQSRMIGDYVYFIAKDYVNYYGNYVEPPILRMDGKIAIAPEVYYFDNPEESYVFHTVASFDIDDAESLDAKTFLMGYSDNLYVSQDNIYLTYMRNLPYRYYQQETRDRFFSVVVPLLPDAAKEEIQGLGSNAPWQRISAVLEEAYNGMGESEKESLIDRIQEALDEYDTKAAMERDQTIVQKIAIKDGAIDYVGMGSVPGRLLNQFSMDEFEGKLRLATTTDYWTREGGSVQFNNVYVLDEGLEQVGKLERLAPGERIYSSRFIGGRLYLVTFKRIDPLFVIDLSEPSQPKVLGELKIPGFSDYLHPYDETHIIGLGKQTGDNEWGGVSIKGLKLALFDVSDVAHPVQVDSVEIGQSGTDSEALRDHKAFLFSKSKGLLVIPVSEQAMKNPNRPELGWSNWQGAQVFTITDQGFALKGRITHADAEDNYYWYYSTSLVRRSLFMDDTLYTISNTKVLMNSLDDLSQINSITLPYSEYRYGYGYPEVPIAIDGPVR
ncbi:MAG: beta-propeller domain-containing protein [Nanoarchaeota archaeon]